MEAKIEPRKYIALRVKWR